MRDELSEHLEKLGANTGREKKRDQKWTRQSVVVEEWKSKSDEAIERSKLVADRGLKTLF